jgi:hypothetical protein
MTVNSISPSQPAQAAQAFKKTEDASSRKQSEAHEVNTVKPRKDAAEHNAQVQKSHEANKPTVNTNGQKVGTVINIAA